MTTASTASSSLLVRLRGLAGAAIRRGITRPAHDLIGLRQRLDGYRNAFEALTREIATVRDDRDRLAAELDRARRSKTAVPPALCGRQLCFLHIGKTAGTSVQHVLFNLMAEAEIFHGSLPEFDAVTQGHLAHFDLVIGHFTHRHLAKCRAERFVMTFLRDPVERLVSNYHFLRSQGDTVDPVSQTAIDVARGTDFLGFMSCIDPKVRMYSANLQCRLLAGDHRPGHAAPAHADQDALLADARRNLAGFDFVGIAEQLDRSMVGLSRELGLAVPLEGRRLNVNAERARAAPPTAEEQALARSLNAADIALYEEAKAAFDRRYPPAS